MIARICYISSCGFCGGVAVTNFFLGDYLWAVLCIVGCLAWAANSFIVYHEGK